jgi:hypothetical protein
MGLMLKKRISLSFLLLLLFLAVIPTTAFYAQHTVNQNTFSDYIEYCFGINATVESVHDELTDIYPESTIVVMDKDGNIRTSGPLEDGDIIKMLDASGKIFRVFVNVCTENSEQSSTEDLNAQVPQSSSEDSGTSSVQASSADSSAISSERTADEPATGASKPYAEDSENSTLQSNSASSEDVSDESSEASSDSNLSSAVSSGTDSVQVSLFENQDYYKFGEPITVEELEDQLALEGVPGSQLTVQTSTGNIRQAGLVCTGDVLTVTNLDGTLQNRVTVVVAGDLTRCGFPNEAACKLLYGYLTDSAALTADLRQAADLNDDSDITTSDLLNLKKMIFTANED